MAARNPGTKGDTNRQRIIEAADTLFYQKGFAHTSFSDIADVTGVPKGNFYYYFKSKDDILAAVIEKRSEDVHAMLEEWNGQFPDVRDRLKRFLQILLNEQDKVIEYGCPMGSMCSELAKLQHFLREDASTMIEIFRVWLEQQFSLLGYSKEARAMSLHLLSRTQGINVIANAYQDDAFLRHEIDQLSQWVDAL